MDHCTQIGTSNQTSPDIGAEAATFLIMGCALQLRLGRTPPLCVIDGRGVGDVMLDANVVLDGILIMTEQLNSLGLSRKMEFEADAKGMELMFNAKINPSGMLTIFGKLLKEELKVQKIKEGKLIKIC